MKTLVIIEVEHRKPIPSLASMVAGRAWTIDGVTSSEVVRSPSVTLGELHEQGFTLTELSLGSQDVHR